MDGFSDANVLNWQREVAESNVLTVVYFWHERCAWCLRFSPILSDATDKYREKIKFVRLNILENEANQEIASTFGVLSTPTLMFFCQGRSVGQIVGAMAEEDLSKVFDDMLARYQQCLTQSTQLRPAYIV
jgi:thioredoxin 1